VESLCHDSCGVEISIEILWVLGGCRFFFRFARRLFALAGGLFFDLV
jgi:hypothetical protein